MLVMSRGRVTFAGAASQGERRVHLSRRFVGWMAVRNRLRFEAHLAGCDGCTRYVAQMRETIRLTGMLTEDDLSPETRDTLLDVFRNWNAEAR